MSSYQQKKKRKKVGEEDFNHTVPLLCLFAIVHGNVFVTGDGHNQQVIEGAQCPDQNSPPLCYDASALMSTSTLCSKTSLRFNTGV